MSIAKNIWKVKLRKAIDAKITVVSERQIKHFGIIMLTERYEGKKKVKCCLTRSGRPPTRAIEEIILQDPVQEYVQDKRE